MDNNRKHAAVNDGLESDPGPRLERLEYREQGCFGGIGSLVLDGRILEVSGALPGWNGPRGPIQLTRVEIDSVYRVLERRGVWGWKAEYLSGECGELVLDGRVWELRVKARGRSHESRGTNAYPSSAANGNVSPRPGFLRQLLHGIAMVIAVP